MHVGFFSPASPTSGASNGIVTYVRVMREALTSLGHSVTVVTPNAIEHCDGTVAALPPAAGKLKAMVERRRGPGAWDRLRILNAFHAARKAGIDVFEIEETFGWASHLKGVPIIIRAHGPHILNKPWTTDYNPHRAVDELNAFRTADAVTFTTQASVDRLIGLTSWRRARVIFNPIEVPTEQWSVLNADPDQILFVGRIDSRKGADIAIEAVSKILNERPSLKLLMVGDGEPIAAPPQVQFLGLRDPEEITKLRLGSALALGTSRFECFPYALIEAMALGMPVVTTDWPGAREVVPDEFVGRVSSVSELPAAILAALGSASLGAQARESVKRRLDPSRIARETLDIYVQALRGD